MEINFDLAGLKEFSDTLSKVTKAVGPDKVEPILLKGARKMASHLRPAAPVGPTGNLKKAVIAKKLQRYGRNPAPSIAAINRKKAPHAHLVESGSGPRYHKRTGRYVGVMPKNPWFQRTEEKEKAGVLSGVVKDLQKEIEGAMK